MIYTNIVNTKAPMKIEKLRVDRDFSFFQQFNAEYFNYPENEAEEKRIKMNQMKIIIAGTMTDLQRNNKNLVSRSLLFLDIDDVKEPEPDMIQKITKALENYNYCIYPTLKYKPIEKVRYRLVMELDRQVKQDEYKILLFGIYSSLGIEYDFDKSNFTWSQGQGLPVKTQYSMNAYKHYQDDKNAIPVNEFLKAIKSSGEYKNSDIAPKKKEYKNTYHNIGGKTKTGVFLDELVAGSTNGNRNRFFTRKIDQLLGYGCDLETIQALINVVNENFLDSPVPQNELDRTFISRMQNHFDE